MKFFTSIFAILLVAQGAVSTITIDQLELFSVNGTAEPKQANFLDCTDGLTAKMMFVITNEAGDQPPTEIVEKVEIDIGDVVNAAIYDVTTDDDTFIPPLNDNNNDFTKLVEEDGKVTTVSLLYTPPMPAMGGKYVIKVINSHGEEAARKEMDVQAIKYCMGDYQLHPNIDTDMCTISPTAGCPDSYIYRDPEASLKLLNNVDQSVVADMPFGKYDVQEDDLTYKFVLNKTTNVYKVNDATPKQLKISYKYIHGDKHNLTESSPIETFDTVGCINWNDFCTHVSTSPPAGIPGLDSSLTCTQTDFQPVENNCRNEIVPKQGKTAMVTFQCSNNCMQTQAGTEVASNAKVMECKANARDWEKQGGSQFETNEWPVCTCGNGARGLTISTVLAVLMIFVSKLF